ncbi:response regulator [Rhabdochromatium marinum]|uniref:response regulator n=1 Tax=Rhabdochromatium marinum TaxID=48729 RepID=UPI0019049EDD|nr:response regulator [Rhabdochromatium marinum]MBK1648828.1 response regulator [Rhabdochromatium marinum]
MHILVVDDDPLAGEMTVAVLEEAGHTCQFAEHGMQALEALVDPAAFELVVSDMNMPLLSGLELFQEMRSQGLETPFVLLTGDDPEPLRARAPGILACLLKDASMEDSLPRLVEQL